ncbi:MAG: ThiF family adenylyltransferase [Pirellulales bacterium]
MDYSRILSSVAAEDLKSKRIAVVGVGAAVDLCCDLARCGVGRFELYDPDRVEPVNLARQGFVQAEIGQFKVDAAARMLAAINPEIVVTTSTADVTQMTDAQIDERFGGLDLLILATDRFAAQAKGNQIALKHNVAAIWIGLYPGGVAGEIIFWHPGIDACYRCLCAKRYAAHERAAATGEKLDPASDGATILDVRLTDAIAGQLAIGLLTRGSDTRYGRLIDALGDRNFLQIKIDPEFMLAGRDVVREVLQVPADNTAYFAWNTIVRRDPDRGALYCDDCHRFRRHEFLPLMGIPARLKPVNTETAAKV